MGEIISLQEGLYNYQLPDIPIETDVWYYDLPKKDQYWKTPHAKNFKWLDSRGEIRNVKQMSERDRIEYINYWREKILYGLWFMNNGVPTYISGMHVEHLIFNKFKGQNFYYMEAQKERFYFRDLTNKEDLCDGRCWIKGRRVGITCEEITEAITCMNSDFFNHVAAQSDTDTKAKITILSKIIDTYTKREKWVRESYYSNNGRIPRSSLELIDSVLKDDGNVALSGTARPFASIAAALDGLEFMLVIMDEFSKWKKTSPYETYRVNQKTIINPGKRGKLDVLSTTGDSKDVLKSVKDWHQLIADSNPKILNENGKTNSGLWYYFVSYIYSNELIEKMWKEKKVKIMDLYGFINKEMAEEYIWNEVKQYPKDSKEYVYSLYKMPMEMRHALLTATNQGYYSKIRITNRLDTLRSLPYDRKPYVIGAFEEGENGKVYFESNKEREARCKRDGVPYVAGRWKVALHPYFSSDNMIDTRNRFRRSGYGTYFPPINPEYCIGYDPIRYRKEDTSSNSLSEAAIIVYKKFDYYNSGEANQYCALYLFRPDDPTDANNECMKAARYYGAPVMHERVIETVKTDFKDANMLPFLMTDPKNPKLHGLWIDSQGKIVQNATNQMVSRFNAPLKTPEDIDYYDTHPFEETLMDMDLFDISDTTQFDCYMAMVELEHGLNQLTFTNLTDSNMNDMSDLVYEIIPVRNKN